MKTFRWPLRYVPRIKLAGRFPMSASNSDWRYCHDGYALHEYLYDGKITLNRTSYAFRAGDVTITPPGVVAVYQLAKDGHHWCVHFDPPPPSLREPSMHLPLHLSVASGDTAHVRERLNSISDTLRPWSSKRGETELAAASAGTLFQALLLFLARQRMRGPVRRKSRQRSDALLDAAKERLDRNFQHPQRISDLAAASGLSRNFFAQRFHQRFGTTVDGYLLHLRIEMARNLLLSTDQAVKEIAFECGIPDPHYFNKQFRRINGTSPSLYRARNRAKW